MSRPGKLSIFARVKRHFDGYLNCNASPGYSGYYITCKWQNSSEEVVPGVLFFHMALQYQTHNPDNVVFGYVCVCVCVCVLSKSMDQSRGNLAFTSNGFKNWKDSTIRSRIHEHLQAIKKPCK